MRVLVTGGMGFVGYAVATVLVEAGHNVTLLTHTGRTQPRPTGTDVINADIRDAVTLRQVLNGRRFEGVCHLAGVAQVRESFKDPLRYFAINASGTLSLLQALTSSTDNPPAVVLASTASIYGRNAEGYLTEESPADPDNPYAASKYAAELVVQQCAKAGLIAGASLRCFAIAGAVDDVGDPDQTRILPKTLRVAAGLEPSVMINGDGSAVREFTHVRDVAEAFYLALTSATPGTYRMFNVGSGQGVTVRRIIEAVESRIGQHVAVNYQSAKAEAHTLVADSSRIRSDLHWQSPASTLDRIVDDAWRALTASHPAVNVRRASAG